MEESIVCQTDTPFESNQCGIETVERVSLVFSRKIFESNQCGIETSARQHAHKMPLQSFESNQCGIETWLTPPFVQLIIYFESNQCGIETLPGAAAIQKTSFL